MSEWYLPSFVGLGISGLTDWVRNFVAQICNIYFLFGKYYLSVYFTNLIIVFQLDGYVARKMRINSVIGSYLDPLADKVDTSQPSFFSPLEFTE